MSLINSTHLSLYLYFYSYFSLKKKKGEKEKKKNLPLSRGKKKITETPCTYSENVHNPFLYFHNKIQAGDIEIVRTTFFLPLPHSRKQRQVLS